jgi:hypothetical protein
LIFGPSAAQAGVKLFTAQWYAESHGNECQGTMTPEGSPGPHCQFTTGAFTMYSAHGFPQGIQCNPNQPRCPLSSTPTGGMGSFSPLGGVTPYSVATVLYCAPLTTYGSGITVRPAKGGTAYGTTTFRIPPLYRNPGFFTSAGQPGATACSPFSTGYTTQNKTRFGKNKGKVMLGNPITGTGSAGTMGGGPLGGFTILPAPSVGPPGVRATGLVGELGYYVSWRPYLYTYATLRNDAGVFGPGQGPGSFNYKYGPSTFPFASINVKQGAAKFGGTMQMLGALTTKACYWGWYLGGCSIGQNDPRFDAIGAPAHHTMTGVLTMGATYTSYTRYYNTRQVQYSPMTVVGSRFPWTTGRVTVTAVGRGPHKTVHYAQGYDNRNTTTTNGLGTVQLVSPLLTHWFGFTDYDTAGIGILRIQFIGTGPDFDVDGVQDADDNCSQSPNSTQVDTDGDGCGNGCDADYDQNGIAGWSDYGAFTQCYATTNELCEHEDPPSGIVGLIDFGIFVTELFGQAPGPSGTTAGTTACP